MTSAGVEAAGAVALHGATLVDGNGGPAVEDAVVVWQRGRILAAGAAASTPIPVDAESLDVSGMTVIPGLMDTHIHLKMGLDDPWKVKALKVPIDLDLPLAQIGIKGFARARQALHMGFTTLRDVGDIGHLGVSLRDLVAAGVVEGPRIVACGENFSATGGTTDFLPDWLSRNDVPSRIADGEDELRRIVRSLVKNRVDWIKFIATGTIGPGAIPQEYTDREIEVIVEEAHARGKPVCAHACYEQGARALAGAGVDSIEHGCELAPDIVELMHQRDIYLVPTLYLFHAIVEDGAELGIPAPLVELARAKLETHVTSFQQAHAAGVRIAAGSDIGSPACGHGTSARELTLLVEYGMTPLEAITAATKVSAQMLRLDHELGTVEAGRLADLVVVDGDPLADIRVLEDARRIAVVVKDGAIQIDRRARP